jgi:hypothetical protein
MDTLTTPVLSRCMVTNSWKASVYIVVGSVKEGKTIHRVSPLPSAGLRSQSPGSDCVVSSVIEVRHRCSVAAVNRHGE